tara:strand:+ start:79 stop:1128 length:1050 start_codon:yes stop_codon:yes gene_type:complete
MKSEEVREKLRNYRVHISVIFMILVVVNLTFIYLFHNGNLRYNLLRLAAETNNIYTDFMLFREIEQRNFPSGVQLLNSQLSHVQGISAGNNQLLDQLITNLKYSFNKTVNAEDRDHFEPLLRELVDLYPDVYTFRIFYAKTLENNLNGELYSHIDSAIKLVGSSPEAYRIGIGFAYREGNTEKLKQYCQEYRTNQEGGMKFNEIPYAFFGIGLRSMMIELDHKDQNIFVRNNGMGISSSTNYEFLLTEAIKMNQSLKLHVASVKGISIGINGITLFKNGNIIKKIMMQDLTLFTESSFLDKDGSIILLADQKPEIIEIFLKSEEESYQVDKIVINISISKLDLTNPKVC